MGSIGQIDCRMAFVVPLLLSFLVVSHWPNDLALHL